MPEFTQTEIKAIVDFVKAAKERLKVLGEIEKLAVGNQQQIRKNQEDIKRLYEVLAGKLINGKTQHGVISRLESLEKLEDSRRQETEANRRESRRLRYTITGGVIIWIITFLIQILVK